MSNSVRPQRWQPTRLPRPWDSPGKNTEVGCHFLLQCMKVKSEREVAQSCPTLSDPMDCSPPDFSIHGIFQARVLEWGATAFSVGVFSLHFSSCVCVCVCVCVCFSSAGGLQCNLYFRMNFGDYCVFPGRGTGTHRVRQSIISSCPLLCY